MEGLDRGDFINEKTVSGFCRRHDDRRIVTRCRTGDGTFDRLSSSPAAPSSKAALPETTSPQGLPYGGEKQGSLAPSSPACRSLQDARLQLAALKRQGFRETAAAPLNEKCPPVLGGHFSIRGSGGV
jgi:hypothetical protein